MIEIIQYQMVLTQLLVVVMQILQILTTQQLLVVGVIILQYQEITQQ
jgi:hypothetical protein